METRIINVRRLVVRLISTFPSSALALFGRPCQILQFAFYPIFSFIYRDSCDFSLQSSTRQPGRISRRQNPFSTCFTAHIPSAQLYKILHRPCLVSKEMSLFLRPRERLSRQLAREFHDRRSEYGANRLSADFFQNDSRTAIGITRAPRCVPGSLVHPARRFTPRIISIGVSLAYQRVTTRATVAQLARTAMSYDGKG